MLETIIIALLGIACIIAAYYITTLENQLEQYENLFKLRIEITVLDKARENKQITDVGYYMELRKLDQEIREIERELEE